MDVYPIWRFRVHLSINVYPTLRFWVHIPFILLSLVGYTPEEDKRLAMLLGIHPMSIVCDNLPTKIE